MATMDTKGTKAVYLRDRIEEGPHDAALIDVGVMDDPNAGEPEVTNHEMAAAAGEDLDAVGRRAGEEELDRVHAMRIMSEGLESVLLDRWEAGHLAGAIGIGGPQGMNITATATQGLPRGVPTLAVSTIASGRNRFGPFVGTKDMTLLHSVTDVVRSPLMDSILDSAAGAISGTVDRASGRDSPLTESDATIIGATMLGTTSPGVETAKALLEREDCEVVVFHANGVGGMAMEDLARQGYFDAVLDLTTSTGSDHLVTLHQNRFLLKEGDEYRGGLTFLEFGDGARSNQQTYQVSRDEIDKLAEETGELAHLSVEQGGQGITIYERDGSEAISLDT